MHPIDAFGPPLAALVGLALVAVVSVWVYRDMRRERERQRWDGAAAVWRQPLPLHWSPVTVRDLCDGRRVVPYDWRDEAWNEWHSIP